MALLAPPDFLLGRALHRNWQKVEEQGFTRAATYCDKYNRHNWAVVTQVATQLPTLRASNAWSPRIFAGRRDPRRLVAKIGSGIHAILV